MYTLPTPKAGSSTDDRDFYRDMESFKLPDSILDSISQSTYDWKETDFKMNGFKIPMEWIPRYGLGFEKNLLQHVDWYLQKFGLDMAPNVAVKWMNIQSKMMLVNKKRDLVIKILSESAAQPSSSNGTASINVHALGLNAFHPMLYSMQEVTGIDFSVQSVLLTQEICADILFEAVKAIELNNLTEYTFICKHATHRSVGMAVLLAILVYHDALLVFSTKRTIRAATKRGMLLQCETVMDQSEADKFQ